VSRLPNDLYAVKDAPGGGRGAGGKLRAGFTRNKTLLGVLGAVAVVGLALVARRKNAAGSTDGASTSTAGWATTPTAAGSYAPYDSSSADLYNAIQPQLEQLQQLARQLPPVDSSNVDSSKWYASESDARRLAIIDDYLTALGRDPSRSEVNFWDAQKFDLAGIRQRIVSSQEAKTTTR